MPMICGNSRPSSAALYDELSGNHYRDIYRDAAEIRYGGESGEKRELWTYIKNRDIRLFHKLRNRIMGQTLNLPGKGGRKLSLTIYKISQKVIGIN